MSWASRPTAPSAPGRSSSSSPTRAIRLNDQLYVGVSPPDLDDFLSIQSSRGFLQVSYLASSPFYFVPADSPWAPEPNGEPYVMHGLPYPDPAEAPVDYIPRLDRVGPPASKVGVADGTRFLGLSNAGGGTILDYEAGPNNTSLFGNYLTSTPALDRSTAYGRTALPVQFDAENVRLSMRYPTLDSAFGRGIHVAHFDGSVGFITAEEAWGDPALWYPTGSVFSHDRASPESQAAYADGAVLP